MARTHLDVPYLSSEERAIEKLEKQMMKGRGRWVADFNESFLKYRVGDVTFDLFISGTTRMKGFILSRLFSFLLNPNYDVGFFATSVGQDNGPNERKLRKWILAVKSCMEKWRRPGMKWAWLVLVGQSPNEATQKFMRESTDRSVGVAYVDVNSRKITGADTYLGRQLKRYIKV